MAGSMRPRFAVLLLVATLVAPVPSVAADADVDRALDAARARAAAGDVIAQFSLGSLLYYGGSDTAQAIEWIRKAAAQGFAPAEFHLGQIYDFGFGAAQNDTQALDWYRRAAGRIWLFAIISAAIDPTTQTGLPLVDGYLGVKTPGESDGPCNGGPRAGQWWPEYALGLSRTAEQIGSLDR